MDAPSPAQMEEEQRRLDKETEKRGLDSFPEPNNDNAAQLKSAHKEMDNTLAGYQETTDVTAPDKSKSLNIMQRIRQLLGRE